MNPSPYDRTASFLRGRYRRSPLAAVSLVLVVLWAIWTAYELFGTSEGFGGWYLELRDFVGVTASGVILIAGIVWLVGLAGDAGS
jgi:hypothetical protein